MPVVSFNKLIAFITLIKDRDFEPKEILLYRCAANPLHWLVTEGSGANEYDVALRIFTEIVRVVIEEDQVQKRLLRAGPSAAVAMEQPLKFRGLVGKLRGAAAAAAGALDENGGNGAERGENAMDEALPEEAEPGPAVDEDLDDDDVPLTLSLSYCLQLFSRWHNLHSRCLFLVRTRQPMLLAQTQRRCSTWPLIAGGRRFGPRPTLTPPWQCRRPIKRQRTTRSKSYCRPSWPRGK